MLVISEKTSLRMSGVCPKTAKWKRRTGRLSGRDQLAINAYARLGSVADPHPLSELIGGTGNDWDERTDD